MAIDELVAKSLGSLQTQLAFDLLSIAIAIVLGILFVVGLIMQLKNFLCRLCPKKPEDPDAPAEKGGTELTPSATPKGSISSPKGSFKSGDGSKI